MSKPKDMAVKTEDDRLPAVYDYGEDADAGFEDTTREDYAVPFLGILQKMSPQVDPDSGSYVDGAKAGMLVNTVTQEMYPGETGVRFVPCHRQHCYVEWVPRDAGGGFVGQHEPESEVVAEARKVAASFNELVTPAGNDLMETFYVFGLLVHENGDYEHMAIAFGSTQIKKYKQWMTRARSLKVLGAGGHRVVPPLFAHAYRLTTQAEENKKGKFHGWRIGFAGDNAEACRLAPDAELYQAAKAFRDLAKSGSVRTEQQAQEAPTEEESF